MLRQVLLLQRDVPKSTKFYKEGLGLKVKVLTERWAELDAGSTTLALKAVEGCGRLSECLQHICRASYEPGYQLMLICIGRLTAPQATHHFCLSMCWTCNRLSATCCNLARHWMVQSSILGTAK